MTADHPADLLDEMADTLRGTADGFGGGYTTANLHLGANVATSAAKFLREHEAANGVTFVALDNDALAAVREAWENKTRDPSKYLGGDLADAVAALLHLERG